MCSGSRERIGFPVSIGVGSAPRHIALVAVAIAALAGCDSAKQEYRADPIATESSEKVALVDLSPGDSGPAEIRTGEGRDYEDNAFHMSEGKRLFAWFNCNGCHGEGGGGSGPPLMDDRWIYGGSIENIVKTIREGRPNGMPSFRGKIPDQQIWELAAYVRSMSGQASQATAPSRNDDMHPHPSENRMPPTPPVAGGIVPPSAETPQ
jgi:cytochrome c oxidase cbb3-type subunit 3